MKHKYLATLISSTILFSCAPTDAPIKESLAQTSVYNTEISSLANNSAIKTALQNIVDTQKAAIAETILLTEIPAPPFKEAKRAQKFAELLKGLGLTNVTIDSVGNVIAVRPGKVGANTVAVVAHIDTVFPEGTDVKVKVDGNVYTAPGVGDNSRGLASLLAVVRALQTAQINTNANILFIGSVGEEGLGDLRGVRHLFSKDGPKIDSFIAVDGGSSNRLIFGAIGSHRYRVTYHGSGGHSWSAFGLPNPHFALGRAIDKIALEAETVYNAEPKVSVSVGRIGGGTSVNSIAFESWMEIDMRSSNAAVLEKMDNAVITAVNSALAEENKIRIRGDALTVTIENIGIRPAGLGDKNGKLVQRSMAAMNHLGLTPSLELSSTDSNIPVSLGIPAITLSRGGKNPKAHSLQESWIDIDTHIAVQTLLLTIVAQAELAD